jgi:hypothetical protein
MIQAPQDKAQNLTSKFDQIEQLLKDSGFDLAVTEDPVLQPEPRFWTA